MEDARQMMRTPGQASRPPSILFVGFIVGLVWGILPPSHAQENFSQLISEGTVVANDRPQSASFQSPPPVEGQVLALEFEARAASETTVSEIAPSEAAYLLKIRLNGTEVSAAADRLQPRLRNKPPTERGLAWHRSLVGWLIPIAAEFPPTPEERFRTLVEVESLLNPDSNRLEFSLLHQADSRTRVHLRNIRLVRLPRLPLAERLELTPAQSPSLQSTPSGDLALRADGLDSPLTTSLGHPGGGWLQRGPPLAHWSPKTLPANPGEQPEQIRTDSLGWARRITQPTPDHLLIEEEITNLTDAETGTMFRIDLPFSRPVPHLYLGGDADPALLQKREPANPTIYVPLGGFGIALVAEDDILRSQAIFAARPDGGSVSLRAERLLLLPKQTLRLRWSLYLLPGNDYFDFVNRLRADWGVSMRIPGAFWWNAYSRVDKPDRDLLRWLARVKPFAAVIGSWVDREQRQSPQTVGLGAGVMQPEFANYRLRLKRFTARLKKLDPSLKVLVYNHYFYNWPERNADRQYSDSWITDEAGKRFINPSERNESPAAGIYPTRTNTFGTAFLETLVRERAEIGIDGFYLDETTAPGRLRDPITYSEADNVTALLDPDTFAVRRKVGDLTLLTAPYLDDLSQRILDARLILLGNFPPQTAAQNRMHWPRFVESDNLSHAPSAHLYSPLAFSYRFEKYTIEDVRERLEQGLVWCVTGPEDRIGITRRFFPLTPTRLHAGWIEAQERIITTRSGTYGWQNETAPSSTNRVRLWIYDAAGKPQKLDPPWLQVRRQLPVEVPPGGIAILERNETPAPLRRVP